MTDDRLLTSDPLEYVQALRLAVEAGASVKSSYQLMGRILDLAPDGDPHSIESVRILFAAIRDLGASVDVP